MGSIGSTGFTPTYIQLASKRYWQIYSSVQRVGAMGGISAPDPKCCRQAILIPGNLCVDPPTLFFVTV